MALSSEQIDTLSKLLDVALELDPAQRESWIASLSPEEQALAEPLREMLANDDKLAADPRFAQLPRMSQHEEVANQGEVVGPYRLLHEIGRGGMGSVWLAERSDGSFKRQVALKLPRLAWGAGLAERMAREREIGALLEHPAIGRMYDAGVDERGRPYLAFEYIDGQPIDAWCESQALTLRQRLTLFLQVIKAVAYAHGRLVVHRDLKPSNVLVTLDGQAHLLDFGIAKLLQDASQTGANLTQEQGRVLTPHYASPEQIAGEPITVASDVYSLGVLLYELLTGVLPVAPRRETVAAIEEAVLQGDIVLASTRVKDMPKRIDGPSRMLGQVTSAMTNSLMHANLNAARASGMNLISIIPTMERRVGLFDTEAMPYLVDLGRRVAMENLDRIRSQLEATQGIDERLVA
jgi:serine/threonine-protein kinase